MITPALAPPAACSAPRAAARGRCRPHSHQERCRFSDQTRGGRYSWARYYHPTLQRFISEDPIGLAGADLNLYAYVSGSPTNYGDPSGLRIEWGTQSLTNPIVRSNLIRLNAELIRLGKADNSFVLTVTSGDRYIDRRGQIREISTNAIVPNSSRVSEHLIENGARGLDLRVQGVDNDTLDRALAHTEFSPANTNRNYRDLQTHVALPNRWQYHAQFASDPTFPSTDSVAVVPSADGG